MDCRMRVDHGKICTAIGTGYNSGAEPVLVLIVEGALMRDGFGARQQTNGRWK